MNTFGTNRGIYDWISKLEHKKFSWTLQNHIINTVMYDIKTSDYLLFIKYITGIVVYLFHNKNMFTSSLYRFTKISH